MRRIDFHRAFGVQERSNVGPPWLYLPGSLAYAMGMDTGGSGSDDTAGKGCVDGLMFTFDSKKSERSAKNETPTRRNIPLPGLRWA